MAGQSGNAKKKKWWILIIACLVIVLILLAVFSKSCSIPGDEKTPSGIAEESAEISSVETSPVAEDNTKESTVMSSVENTTTLEESVNVSAEERTESESDKEAEQTLSEETTEAAVETGDSGSEKWSEQDSSPEEAAKATPSSIAAEPMTEAPTTKATSVTQPSSAEPTQPSHHHRYTGEVTKAAMCGETGVVTYTCSCGDSFIATIQPIGNHSWIEQVATVHHDAETHVVHHEAETHVVHHDEEGHWEYYAMHTICNWCHLDYTHAAYELLLSPEWPEKKAWYLANISDPEFYADKSDYYIANNYCFNMHWVETSTETGGFHGSYHMEYLQVAEDEYMMDESPEGTYIWTTIDNVYVKCKGWVVDTEAWDETIVDKESWDEIVVDREAWDEEVITGYVCSECGAVR